MKWMSLRLNHVIGAPSLRVETISSMSGSIAAHSMSCSIETRSVGSIAIPGGSASSRLAAAARAAASACSGVFIRARPEARWARVARARSCPSGGGRTASPRRPSPSKIFSPPSSTISRSHVRSMSAESCETSTSVAPAAICSAMRASHLRWNASSPTASTSSISSTSASRCAAIEKPRRRNMPDEYVATGASMKSPSSENSMIASIRASICSLTRPCSAPLRKMFSRPEKSRPKPAPSSSWATICPPQATRPEFSGTIPDSTRSVEDLPAPLRPTIPTVSPGSIRSETSLQRLHGRRPAGARAADQQLLQRAAAVGAHAERARRVLEHDLAGAHAVVERAGRLRPHTTTASSPCMRRNSAWPATSAIAAATTT